MEGQQWTKLLVLLDQNSSEYEHLSINEAFLKFYNETNNIPHEEWLSEQLAETPTKSNTKAETFRSLGNKFYCRGNFKESIKWYTMSLHFAIHNGAEYGKALANRSAASFALEQYDECLKDIGACFASEYPVELQQKVLLRKLQAYYHLDMDDEFNKQVLDMEDEFKDTEIFQQCINNYKNKDRTGEGKKSPAKLDPENLLLMNETFAFATDLVELRYNSEKGRHVIAAKDIEPNSILFKEEAFVAAQIFKSREELEHEVCYNCLKHIPYFSLPCPSCTYCLYCSENCKTTSWSSSHRFECPGMIIFYELGQALPAFSGLGTS